jgi:chromosomal replication initiator protein
MTKQEFDAKNLKDSLLTHLREHHPTMCRRWFSAIEPAGIVDGSLHLLVREQVQLKYLQRCCTEQFIDAAQTVTGHLLGVRFIGEEQEIAQPVVVSAPGNGAVLSDHPGDEEMLISPDHCFDNFVIGPGNQLAQAASVAVSQKPGQAYNPLFIHGGVGLGKTHLLQAICQTAMSMHHSMRILYVSCNGFMTQFLESVQAGEMASFRHRFRAFDMLVIDDIHDLSKRDRTQEEFFHTFNTLFQSGRQIVLSSDAPPAEIPDMEERLISRFACGLVASIEAPSYETRVAIIKKKASLRHIDIPDDVAAYVAARLDSNIRELEGAITKLQGLSLVERKVIDMEMAKRAISRRKDDSSANQHLSIQDILEAIATYYDVKLSDILSKRRHKSITGPRQIGMWLARHHTRFSLEEIGGYFGGRDHTTVMHAIKTVDQRRGDDQRMQRDLSQLENRLND